MSSSLSEQLRRLALPQTTTLQSLKKRASLLFDPKEAAGIRRETIYQIGLDGLEELIKKNEAFEQFKHTLFDITSKKFERSVQTVEENKKLDKVIRKFLLHLSPYFLLSCAHKALEWLINRYAIHEYNREDLLITIMPYHESNIFVRVIQLMKFKDQNDNWFFLKSLQKSGVHLTKQSLLAHAVSDVNFIKIVAKFIGAIIKEFEKPSLLTVAFNFYCAVFTGVIEYSQQLDEAQVTQMLPALLRGLSSDIPDYCAASYIVLSRLVMKTSLSNTVLDTFIVRVINVKVENLKNEAALVLLILYQSQTHYTAFPQVACKSLSLTDWLPKIIQDLNNKNYYVTPLLKAIVKSFLKGAIKKDEENYRTFLKDLLAAVKFEESFIESFMNLLLDATKLETQYTEDTKLWLIDIIETLERQYPDQIDIEFSKILSSTQHGKVGKRRKSLQKILHDSMTLRCKYDVLAKLHHTNASCRIEGVRYLLHNFETLRDREKEMIRSSFKDRLNDDDPNVVSETLTLNKSVSVLKNEDLKPILLKVAYGCQKDLRTWGSVAIDIILTLCGNSCTNDWDTFIAIFPYLLPTNEEQLKAARKICKTSFVKENVLLKRVNPTFGNCEQFCNSIFDSLRNENCAIVDDFVSNLEKEEDLCVLKKYLATLILSCILPNNSSIETNLRVIKVFVKFFESSEIKYEKSNAFFQKHLAAARYGEFHIEAFLLCLKNVILKTKQPDIDWSRVDFSDINPFNDYFITLANSLFKKLFNYKKYITLFVNHFCKTLKNKIGFLFNLGNSEKCQSDEFLEECVSLIIRLLQQGKDVNNLCDEEIIVVNILATLLHKSESIKKKIFKILEILLNVNDFYKKLFLEFLNWREEIIADSDQVPLALSSFFRKYGKLPKMFLQATYNNYPVYLKAKTLELLSHVPGLHRFEETALDCLKYLDQDLNGWKSIVVVRNLFRFKSDIAKQIRLNTNIWKLLEECIRRDELTINYQNETNFVAILLLDQFSKDFFYELDYNVKLQLLDVVIEIGTTTKNSELLSKMRHFMKSVELDLNLILLHFIRMRNIQSPKLDPNKLKRRINVVPTIDILDTLEWRKGLTCLEIIQDKKKLRNVEVVIPILFEILKKCLDFDEQAAVEYPKQLILASILYLGKRTDCQKMSETVFNMELIVQCIRASQNPQTHYCALLLLAFSAELFPTQVLHNVMAIFTFMGSSLVRHEDAYSLQIITKIIDTIVPILVKDCEIETIGRVLRVFADVLLDVPEHRRIPIYKQLLTKIGASEYLYIFLLLIFESHINHVNKASQNDDSKRLEIAVNICAEFSPEVVIQNCIHLLKYLKELPDDIDRDTTLNFDIYFKTPKQFRHYKYTCITFISKLLTSREFVIKVALLKDENLVNLEQLYKDMIINNLTYIHRISKVADKNAMTQQAKYWKIILHLSYDILDSVNAILTPQMFILVTKGLMVHNFTTVRRRSMELLNSKLQNQPTYFTPCSKEEMYSLLAPILSLIKSLEEQVSVEEELIQTALLSLKLLIRFLIEDYTNQLTEILSFFTELIKSDKTQQNVLASLLLCSAELYVHLRAHAIPCLPNFMPALIKILKQQKSKECSSLLLLSSVTTVQKIIETLPLFLSPYLEKLVYELVLLTCGWTNGDNLLPVTNKLLAVYQKIGTSVPSRILIAILEQTYNRLVEKNAFNAIGFLLEILNEHLKILKANEINANLPELTNFFLNALQFRSDQNASFELANEVEAHIVKTLTKLVLKLSESAFKPLYYKLYDWAIRHEEKSERLITFYGLSSQIAEALKTLFVLFAGHFLNNAAQILDTCNLTKSNNLYFEHEDKNILLLENVLKTLYAVFRHDNHKFINKDRFQILMQPLVDQLENTLGGDDVFKRRIENLVTPTMVEFVVATADDSLWKLINYQILLKMKHSSSNIRLASLHCLKEMVAKVGVDYLPLLPETIPVLAELLEDEEETVEKVCRRTVQEMENILGEPIEKYFKI